MKAPLYTYSKYIVDENIDLNTTLSRADAHRRKSAFQSSELKDCPI